MEWWKSDQGEGDDGPDCREEGASDAIWGIDEDEVVTSTTHPATMNALASSSQVILDSLADDSRPNVVSLTFCPAQSSSAGGAPLQSLNAV